MKCDQVMEANLSGPRRASASRCSRLTSTVRDDSDVSSQELGRRNIDTDLSEEFDACSELDDNES